MQVHINGPVEGSHPLSTCQMLAAIINPVIVWRSGGRLIIQSTETQGLVRHQEEDSSLCLLRWSKRRGKATHNCGCQQTMWLSSITSLVFLSMIVFANAQAPQRTSQGSLHKKAEKGFFLTSAWNWTCLSWSRPVRSVYVKILSICCPLSRHF